MNRARRRQRLASENPEQREARLFTRRARRTSSLKVASQVASETPELVSFPDPSPFCKRGDYSRTARDTYMERVRTRRRLASETAEQRETRLCRCGARRARQTSQTREPCLASHATEESTGKSRGQRAPTTSTSGQSTAACSSGDA